MMTVDSGNMYPVDLFAMGSVKRCLSNSAAFRLLILNWNLVAARTLLRVQLDTALRFHAVFLVSDPHEFSIEVLRGTHIRKLKGRDGKPLTDAHLVSLLSPDFPWLPEVYRRTSGFIHLSESHLSAPATGLSDESGTINYEFTDQDLHYPEFSWREAIKCFTEATDIFLHYLTGWVDTKANPPPHPAGDVDETE